MSQILHVTVTAANFKRMEPKDYGVTERVAKVIMKLGDQVQETKEVPAPSLDPTWEESFQFNVSDPATDKLTTEFYLGGKQIGQHFEITLNGLFKNKTTFKGMPVVGGKIDFLVRAENFGPDEEPTNDEEGGFWDVLG